MSDFLFLCLCSNSCALFLSIIAICFSLSPSLMASLCDASIRNCERFHPLEIHFWINDSFSIVVSNVQEFFITLCSGSGFAILSLVAYVTVSPGTGLLFRKIYLAWCLFLLGIKQSFIYSVVVHIHSDSPPFRQ